MAHIWFMHDAHLGCALFFLDMLAEYTLLSMTIMVTPCLSYVVGMNLVCPMSKFRQAPFARAPFGECRDIRANDPRMSAGYLSPKLPLWADFSFLKIRCVLARNCPNRIGLFPLATLDRSVFKTQTQLNRKCYSQRAAKGDQIRHS